MQQNLPAAPTPVPSDSSNAHVVSSGRLEEHSAPKRRTAEPVLSLSMEDVDPELLRALEESAHFSSTERDEVLAFCSSNRLDLQAFRQQCVPETLLLDAGLAFGTRLKLLRLADQCAASAPMILKSARREEQKRRMCSVCNKREFYCKGMCRACYERTPERKEKLRIRQRRYNKNRARKAKAATPSVDSNV